MDGRRHQVSIIYNNVYPDDINSFTLQTSGDWAPVVAISQADGGTLLSMT